MAVRGLTLSSSKRHVYSGDPDKDTDGETIWLLKPIDVFVQTSVLDNCIDIRDESENPLKIHRMHLETVRFGLAGWENFIDEHGKQVDYVSVESLVSGRKCLSVAPEKLGLIPAPVLRELSLEIANLSRVSDTEAKN